MVGYKVYLNRLESDSFELIYDGTNFPSTLTYTATGLSRGIFYRFKVTALNAIGEGPDSTIASY